MQSKLTNLKYLSLDNTISSWTLSKFSLIQQMDQIIAVYTLKIEKRMLMWILYKFFFDVAHFQ